MKRIIGVLTLIALLVVAGCTSTPTGNVTGPKKEDIKIGLLLPLTGEAASWGQNALAGITLATNKVNAKGGINGQKIKLIAEDDGCSPDSVSAIQKLINVDQVTAILGPICSAAAGPAVPIAQQNGVPTVMVAASAPDLTKTGDFIFRVYPSDAFQGKEGAEFIFNKLGNKEVAVVYVQNDWGEGIKNVFIQHFESLGGKVVYEAGVTQAATDLRTELTKIENSGAEVLYFPVYPNNGLAGFKAAKEMGLDLTIVGADAFAGEEVVQSGFGDGVIYSVPKIEGPDSFNAQINSVPGFADLQISIAAPLGYDAAGVMFSAIQKAGTDRAAIKSALQQTSYPGVSTELIEFDSIGDLKSAIYEFNTIQNKESVPYRG